MSAPFAALDAGMLGAAVEALRPLPPMTPAEWAVEHRDLREGSTARPGSWSNDVFPYLVSFMNVVQEAIESGARGVAGMKSGQGGGSEAFANAWGWLQTYYPGPMLYLIGKDEQAREFSEMRFGWMAKTAGPLRRKHLKGKQNLIRFTDGKLDLRGGQSMLNIQTEAYRIVFIDEYDSMQDSVDGLGDPLKIAEIRTDAFPSETLIIVFAHPTTRERGVGRVYYELSDQRRGFVACYHCGTEFWFQPEHLKAIAREGQSQAKADRDPSCYVYVAPCCGAEISDAQRISMVRAGVTQRSTLPPEEAATKGWIGVHFSQFYMPNKSTAFLAEKHIEGFDDETIERVVVNKRWGDVYRGKVQETTVDQWRELIVLPRGDDDNEAYLLGEVPSWVRFLTAGQDSNSFELHWSIWGWGLRRDADGIALMCGALIDAGAHQRPPPNAPELSVRALASLDQVLYHRRFPYVTDEKTLRVHEGGHDSGWQPVAVWEYCRRRRGRATAVRGDACTETSTQPAFRRGNAVHYVFEGEQVSDPDLRPLVLNTFVLKASFFGMVGHRFKLAGSPVPRSRLVLPRDVSEEWLAQAASERLELEKGKRVWKNKGPNHYSDTNIYAYGLALNLDPFQFGRTRDEQREAENAAKQQREGPGRRRAGRQVRRRY